MEQEQVCAGMLRPKRVRVWQIFKAYITSMIFAFTGGLMTLPLLQQQLADKYELTTRDKVLEYFALSQTIPGVISLSNAILIGREIAGWAGAFAAMAGCLLPAFFGMLLITITYSFISEIKWVYGIINGIRAASVAVIFSNALILIGDNKTAFGLTVALIAFVTTFFFGWNILLVVILCGFASVIRQLFLQRAQTENK